MALSYVPHACFHPRAYSGMCARNIRYTCSQSFACNEPSSMRVASSASIHDINKDCCGGFTVTQRPTLVMMTHGSSIAFDPFTEFLQTTICLGSTSGQSLHHCEGRRSDRCCSRIRRRGQFRIDVDDAFSFLTHSLARVKFPSRVA